MGPFELMDLTAIDVTHPATELLYRQTYDEPRYRPTSLMKLRLDAGLLGRKVGRGFYVYKDGKKQEAPEAPAPAYDGRPVWVSPVEAEGSAKLKAIVSAAGGKLESGAAPSAEALILVTPIGDDATSTAVAQGLDATRTLAVDTLFGLETRRTLMKTPVTRPEFTAAAHGLLGGGSVHATVIHDTPGFVCQRVVAAIVNIGASVAQARVAAPADVDKAVVLGVNYPKGPLAWADAVGPRNIVRILEGIQRVTGDPRYRPSPWLRRRAALGVSMLTPEA
ncbi:MAG: 3-hydroxyacyl-CoA dehydrogenase, partial [Hyphomicrobiaceae bacterium]|nr:3-hydroxyacyl-CoA dehydrogenase [Hyphomicrobiaceae bacterium]